MGCKSIDDSNTVHDTRIQNDRNLNGRAEWTQR